jgi:acetyl-CoA synthetase
MAEDSNRVIPPKPDIARRAHIGSIEEYERLYRLSLDDPGSFWAKQADRLSWFHPWNQVFDHDYENVDFGWFLGGRSPESTNTSPTASSSTR